MSYSSEVLADSPSVYWRLGEASGTVAADSSGNGRDATYTNTPTLGATGALVGDTNKAMTVAANTGQRATIADAAWAHTSTMTVEAWVNFSSAFDSGNGDGIVAKYAAGGFQFLLWRSTTNHIAVQFVNSAVSAFNVADTGSPSTGVWYHVVATIDGSNNCRLYINGTQAGITVPLTGTLGTGGSNPIEVGRYTGNDATTPGATIDEVAIYYGTALSLARISAHYLAGIGTLAASGSGSLSLSGSGAAAVTDGGTGSLSLSASGTATASPAGSGSLTLSGSGGTVAPTPASGSGSIALTGSGADAAATAGSAALTLAGSGTGVGAAAAAGSAALTLTGQGSATLAVAGAGSISFSAIAAAIALYLTDTTNALNGRRRHARGTATVDRPAVPPPLGRTRTIRYDKAIAYPVPTMVDGRPT